MRPALVIRLLVPLAILVAVGCGPAAPVAPAGPPNVTVTALAGPTCPVVRPGDPACDARPVVGAVVVIRDEGGAEVARVTTGPNGTAEASLPTGSFAFEAQPVDGLMGTPGPTIAAIEAGVAASIELEYDTGIR